MRCDEVAALLPGLVDGVDESNLAVERHVEYVPAVPGRPRALPQAAAHARAPAHPLRRAHPGLLGDTLAALSDATERNAMRTIVTGRRLAYAGAIGGTVATAATALLIARSRRRSLGRAAPRQLRRAPARRAVS